MELKFFCKGLSEKEEEKLQDYVQKKIPSFDRLMSHCDEDTVQLQVNAKRFEKNNAFEVEFILKVPKKTIIGSEASHSIEKAVDLAKDRVMKQLKKHAGQLRGRTYEKVVIIEGLERIHHSLKTYKEKEEKKEFQIALRPLLRRLEQFVKREIYHHEEQKGIKKGHIDGTGIVDEVVADFYENFHAHSKESEIEEWLYSVAIKKIEAAVREWEQEKSRTVSWEQKLGEKDDRRLSSYFKGEDLESLEAHILSDEEGGKIEAPEKLLRQREAFEFVIEKLTDIPPLQRHAFMLHAIEGFQMERIAKIQKRDPKEVQHDIEQVRKVLFEKIQEEFGEEVM